jgi:phage terminase large subunit-like protein
MLQRSTTKNPASPSIAATLAEALSATTWLDTARANQLAPPGDWSIWMILAGRGFGKTRAGAEWIKGLVESGSRVAP